MQPSNNRKCKQPMIEIEDNQEKEWESSFFDDSEDGENPKTVRGPNAPKDL